MCKAIRKIVSSPFKLAAGILAPGGGGGGGDAAQAQAPATDPTSRASTDVQGAAELLRKRMGRRQGYASTLLTGGTGVTPTPSATNTSLGGGG